MHSPVSSMDTLNDSLQFLTGGGENGALIRAFDWSKTSLGHPASWPKSLKTCVRIILTSRQPMFVWWGEDLINIYNDAYKAIVGGKHPEAMGQPAREVWKEIWQTAVGPRAEKVMAEDEGTYDEALLLIMERNGYKEETYYTFSYSPVPGDDGKPAGIICANTDDTDRIIGERQLRTLKDLGKSYINSKSDSDIYRNTISVFDENPHDFPFAMLYNFDEHTESYSLVGISEPVSKDIAPETFTIDEKSKPWFISNSSRLDGPVIIKEIPPELPKGIWPVSPSQCIVLPIAVTGQANAYGMLVVGLNPYRLADEKYIGFFKLVTDQIASGISNIKAYEEEQKRIAALTEIDKAKTVFFNNVSHEFRTPLTLMLGPLEDMVKHDDALPKNIRENIEFTYRNSQRLLKLVNSLLEFSRIEAGRVQASFKPIDLALLTTDLASGFRSTIEKAGLKYEVDSDITAPVYVDAEMWEKIVLNLLSNAFKYTLVGKIKLRLSQTGKNAVLEVEDTGVGIPKAELPKMFQRFHRVPNTVGRTHEGTGIGLSLIHELVKMHHGEIAIESTEGKGSKFIVTIPLGKNHLPEAQVTDKYDHAKVSTLANMFVDEASSLLSGHQNDGAMPEELEHADETLRDDNTHVLVVDDNADMRTYLQRLIEPYFSVSAATNGKEALDIINNIQPNLVVSDVMMPVMNGKELVQAVRKDPDTARLPFILLSARAGEEARIDGLEAGADDYLVKPFSGRELITKIRSQITIARARNHADELIKQLFINAPLAICILRGPNLVVELANRHILEIWARSSEEILNKPLMEVLPELEGQGFDELLTSTLTTGKRYVSDEQPANLLRHGKMERVFVKFIYEPLYETDGTISGVIVLAHEITDLVTARITAQQNAEEMKEQLRRKDEFMSVASHELKTPVTTMKAALQILDRMHIADPKASGFISKTNRQMDRLAVLVSDLLDVTSIQAGKMKFYLENFSLNELLGDVIEQHQQSEAGHRILLESSDEITIQADRNRLEQVINNFLSNAVKYSPEADRIIVTVKKTNNEVKLSVKDFGIGIPEEKLAYVFDRFYRVEESTQKFSGLGLGLYISAEIIRRHGGRIGASRNNDTGSTFWFTLPLAKSTALVSKEPVKTVEFSS